MKNKIKNTVLYGVPLVIVLIMLTGYAQAKSDYKDAGIDCNYKALDWTKDMDRIESLYFYEQYYVSCMRSNGYLLNGFDYTLDAIGRN